MTDWSNCFLFELFTSQSFRFVNNTVGEYYSMKVMDEGRASSISWSKSNRCLFTGPPLHLFHNGSSSFKVPAAVKLETGLTEGKLGRRTSPQKERKTLPEIIANFAFNSPHSLDECVEQAQRMFSALSGFALDHDASSMTGRGTTFIEDCVFVVEPSSSTFKHEEDQQFLCDLLVGLQEQSFQRRVLFPLISEFGELVSSAAEPEREKKVWDTYILLILLVLVLECGTAQQLKELLMLHRDPSSQCHLKTWLGLFPLFLKTKVDAWNVALSLLFPALEKHFVLPSSRVRTCNPQLDELFFHFHQGQPTFQLSTPQTFFSFALQCLFPHSCTDERGTVNSDEVGGGGGGFLSSLEHALTNVSTFLQEVLFQWCWMICSHRVQSHYVAHYVRPILSLTEDHQLDSESSGNGMNAVYGVSPFHQLCVLHASALLEFFECVTTSMWHCAERSSSLLAVILNLQPGGEYIHDILECYIPCVVPFFDDLLSPALSALSATFTGKFLRELEDSPIGNKRKSVEEDGTVAITRRQVLQGLICDQRATTKHLLRSHPRCILSQCEPMECVSSALCMFSSISTRWLSAAAPDNSKGTPSRLRAIFQREFSTPVLCKLIEGICSFVRDCLTNFHHDQGTNQQGADELAARIFLHILLSLALFLQSLEHLNHDAAVNEAVDELIELKERSRSVLFSLLQSHTSNRDNSGLLLENIKSQRVDIHPLVDVLRQSVHQDLSSEVDVLSQRTWKLLSNDIRVIVEALTV